jgi:ABC-type transport system substrate-binding protein
MATLTDFNKVIQLGFHAQSIVAEQVPWVFVAQPDLQIAARSYVTGVTAYLIYFDYEKLRVVGA